MAAIVAAIFLVVFMLAAGVDAWNDRTPRDPVVRKRIYTPQVWWATRRSNRERGRAAIALSSERTEQ